MWIERHITKWDLDILNPYPYRYPKSSEAHKRKGSSLKDQKIKVIIYKRQNITKKNVIMHINIDIQIEGIRTITTIKEIEIHLTLNGQIIFILEVLMVDFMN
jgi:hypothetical protein